MKAGDLSLGAFRQMLSTSGMLLRTGPIFFRIRTEIALLADGIHFLYRDFNLEEQGVAHFRVCVQPPGGLGGYIRNEVNFSADGYFPFLSFPSKLALPLFEWGMNWCVHARLMDHLILHSAVVERAGEAILLSGLTGSGKSTLCAALILKGWRLLSDELTLVRLSDGAIQPIARPVGLKDKSIEIVRALLAGSSEIGPSASDTHKGTVAHLRPPLESVLRAQETSRPKAIFFLSFNRDAEPDCSPVSRAQAFYKLAADSFNYGRLGVAGFEAMAALIDSSKSYRLSYSTLEQAEELILNAISAA